MPSPIPSPTKMLDTIFSLARRADAALSAPTVENARRAMKVNEHRAAARAALDVDLERFRDPALPEPVQMGGAK